MFPAAFSRISQAIPKRLPGRLCFSSRSADTEFFKVSEFSASSAAAVNGSVVGEVIDHAIDLKNVRPGETIEVPYEVTVSHSFRDFWQSAFYSHERINTSTPFARALGFQDQVVPFSLMLFLAASMSHADHAKLQVGFKSAKYHWPAFAGDTFKKSFTIRSLKNTRDGRHSLCTILCRLTNQRGVTIFTCDKTMLFPFNVPASDIELPSPVDDSTSNAFLQHLVTSALSALAEKGSQTLTSVRPGQLVLHTLTRPLSETHTMQLATLARLTHERHFNNRLYRKEEMLVPGGLVCGLTCSLSSRDLHEILFEEMLECAFPNNLAPGDTVGAFTFITALEEHVSGEVEALTVRTIGVKNCDVKRVLAGVELPIELFTLPLSKLRPQTLEELLKKQRPELSKLVVCIVDRRLYRQAPKQVPFLL